MVSLVATLNRKRAPLKFVRRLWGFTYADVLHIYGLSRAGFVPQLFSLRLPNPTVVYELLQKSRARALICDEKFNTVLANCPVAHYTAVGCDAMVGFQKALPELSMSSPGDIAFIFHTSGSTSGSPKLVPCSHRWVATALEKSRQICKPKNAARQDVTVWMYVCLKWPSILYAELIATGEACATLLSHSVSLTFYLRGVETKVWTYSADGQPSIRVMCRPANYAVFHGQ